MKPIKETNQFAIYNGDCVETLAGLPDNTFDCSVFSSPFSSLYIYSDSERDMGNSASNEEFLVHHGYMAKELYRVMKEGAVICDHVKDTVFYQNSSENGEGGLYPFSDAASQSYRDAGFTLRARVTVWRDPVREQEKTKHERLLYKNIGQNSRVSAMGMPEYILIYRKESKGVKVGNPVPHAVNKWGDIRFEEDSEKIARENLQRMVEKGIVQDGDESRMPMLIQEAKFHLKTWQKWASPVWMDTNQTDVLHARFKAPGDERHICPMPLDLIERCLTLYSRPGDVVIDPFNGIGSTGYKAVTMGRKYVGIELKKEYAEQAAKYIDQASKHIGDLLEG